MKQSTLHTAKAVKNDEFYTLLGDIENELRNYKSHFAGKTVYCNCDDPEWSKFHIFFLKNFEHLRLKSLITTHYSKTPGDQAYSLEYSTSTEQPKKTWLSENGDFRSAECIELMKRSDLICTNPPFSLFKEYVAQLVEHKKDFLIIGSLNAITYKQVFEQIKADKLWLGVTKPQEFTMPDGGTKKFGNICWFTTLSHNKRKSPPDVWRTYSVADYQNYTNFDAINIDKSCDIPIDYKGLMGVPITFLKKYNPDDFEIIDISPHFFEAVKNGQAKPKQLKLAGKKDPYARLIIKWRRSNEN